MARAALVREWLEEEVLYRRAIELGLDRNDTIVRRRLVQRMRFLLDDTHRIDLPTDTELRAWFEEHSDRFAIPAETGFRHRFFSRGRHGAKLEAAARSALRAPQRDSNAMVDDDPFFRGSELDDMTPAEIKRAFGAEFEKGIAALSMGQWIDLWNRSDRQAGSMFWLTRKKLSGSYFAFTRRRRS